MKQLHGYASLGSGLLASLILVSSLTLNYSVILVSGHRILKYSLTSLPIILYSMWKLYSLILHLKIRVQLHSRSFALSRYTYLRNTYRVLSARLAETFEGMSFLQTYVRSQIIAPIKAIHSTVV